MSLAVAVRTAAGFAIAADGRCAGHLGGMARSCVKTFPVGGWLAAWVGDVAVAQAFVERCNHVPAVEVADILQGARRAILDDHGAKRDDGTRFLDLDVLAIGKGGIFILRGTGALLEIDEPFAAIGCADEWATGWMDAVGNEDDPDGADAITRRCVCAAMERYPGVGGAISVLHG